MTVVTQHQVARDGPFAKPSYLPFVMVSVHCTVWVMKYQQYTMRNMTRGLLHIAQTVVGHHHALVMEFVDGMAACVTQHGVVSTAVFQTCHVLIIVPAMVSVIN